MSATRVRVCGIDELPEGTVRSVALEDRTICLAHCAGGVHALDDVCSHEDFPLSEGELDADACEIECYKHGSLFSLITGEALTLPATRPVKTYAVAVEDGAVFVELP